MIDLENYLCDHSTDFRYADGRKELTCVCPLCEKESGHFYIHIHEDNRFGKWNCFKCDAHGDLWSLIAHLEGITRVEAQRRKLISLRKKPEKSAIKRRLQSVQIRFSNKEKIQVGLPYGYQPIQEAIPRYLKSRGIKLHTARRYQLGFACDGECKGRIIFPIHCTTGTSWTARATWPCRIKYKAGKYAGQLLYGWDEAMLLKPNRLVICEGPMDVLAMAQIHVPAIALMGISLSDARAMVINQAGIQPIIMLDTSAQDKAIQIGQKLFNPSFALLEKDDPADNPIGAKRALRQLFSMDDMVLEMKKNRLKKASRDRLISL
jgi:DNA primase